MALDAGAIADGGVIMTPHLLDQVTDSQGQTVQAYKPKPWPGHLRRHRQQAHRPDALRGEQSNGTGVAAQIPGVQVAGKTGTAQTGGPNIEAWFAAFAPVPDPQIAVAVLVENQPSGNEFQGGTIAAPIAKSIIEAYLQPGSKRRRMSRVTRRPRHQYRPYQP